MKLPIMQSQLNKGFTDDERDRRVWPFGGRQPFGAKSYGHRRKASGTTPYARQST